ncbi:hypothetical protein, partial [Achromobacter xylosoxidans]|uniref:hypothetical protein n=1 Tax=Alcaligenes xylosoxydans xylosoxydans TaxID=85698 RepID=UPI001A951C00
EKIVSAPGRGAPIIGGPPQQAGHQHVQAAGKPRRAPRHRATAGRGRCLPQSARHNKNHYADSGLESLILRACGHSKPMAT